MRPARRQQRCVNKECPVNISKSITQPSPMKTKINFVKLTRLLKKNRKLATLVLFLKDMLRIPTSDVQTGAELGSSAAAASSSATQKYVSCVNLEEYFLSVELTLLTYNIVLNGLNDAANLKVNIILVLTKLFERELTEEQHDKIMSDIAYITEKRLFTKVSWMYVGCYNVYDFFFA